MRKEEADTTSASLIRTALFTIKANFIGPTAPQSITQTGETMNQIFTALKQKTALAHPTTNGKTSHAV